MSLCKLRHVCFKDLEDYVKKDDYLSNLSLDEQAIVRQNIGVYDIYAGTYELIKEIVDKEELREGQKYIIEGFKSIYKANNDKVLESDEPYTIILTAVNWSLFDEDVVIVEHPNWEVKYNFLQSQIGEVYDQGQIIFLRDEDNNSAYFDFKNIKIFNKGKYFYTFNADADNVSLSKDCINVIFEDSVRYITATEAKNTIFEKNGNNVELHNVSNVVFKSSITDSKLYNIDLEKEIDSEINNSTVTLIGNNLYKSYFDIETMTQQHEIL